MTVDNAKHYLRSTLFAGVLAGCALHAAEKSIWNYAMPSADAVIYINTKQAEKSMTPSLWKRIQEDKNKALEENAEDRLFDTKNRDAEAVINLFLHSMVPLKASIEGVAMISGNVKGDIAKLLQPGKDSAVPMPQIMKQNDLDFYQYKLNGDGKIPPANFTFSLDRDGLLHFRATVNPDKKQQLSLSSNNVSGKPTLVSGLEQKDLSFAAVVRTEKLSAIPAGSPGAGKVKEFLDKLNTISATGRVQGNSLRIDLVLNAKNEQIAGELHQTIQPVVKQLSMGFSQQLQGLSVNIKKRDVQITGKINIAAAWNLIDRVTRKPSGAEQEQFGKPKE